MNNKKSLNRLDVSNKQWELIKITMAKKENQRKEGEIVKIIVIGVLIIGLGATISRLSDYIKDNEQLQKEIDILKSELESSRNEKVETIKFWTDEYDKKKVPDSVKFVPIKLDIEERNWFSEVDFINKDCENFFGIKLPEEEFEILIERREDYTDKKIMIKNMDYQNMDYKDGVEINLVCGTERRDATVVSSPMYIYKKQCPEGYEAKPFYTEKDHCILWNINYHRCLEYGEPIKEISKYGCVEI